MRLLINVDVDDLGRAEAFYCAAFGLVAGRRFGGDGVELLGGAAPLYLLRHAAGTVGAANQARDYHRHWTPVHLDWVVDTLAELDAAVARSVAAGASLERPRQTHAWGTIAGLADPFGHGFCVLAFSARGYDAIADPPSGRRDGGSGD
jgi:predicted enzyme related to lactoylglutathione lyase